MAWFKDWFNSPYYHLLYSNRDESEAQKFINNIHSELNLNSIKILDLACGKGRHSQTLNQLGHNVTGIDLSEESIKFAKKNENNSLTFYVHDMRIPFIENEFDLIVNLFTSFGYFDDKNDNLMTLNSVYYSLKKNGLFIQDYFNSNYVIKHLIPENSIELNGILFTITKTVDNNTLIKTIEINDKGTKEKYQERVDLLTLENFEHLYHQSNLNTLKLWGDYNLNSFNQETSERLIILSQKQ